MDQVSKISVLNWLWHVGYVDIPWRQHKREESIHLLVVVKSREGEKEEEKETGIQASPARTPMANGFICLS